MSKPANKKTRNTFGNLFDELYAVECITKCELYSACGGNKQSAPCGCTWPASSGMRHKCDKCDLICRERTKDGPHGPESDVIPHISTGSLLDQVRVEQTSRAQFPLFIPTKTEFLAKDHKLTSLRWVAADVRTLFNATDLDPHFATDGSTREYLRVNSECNLIAVMNGKDHYLEAFWAIKQRRTLFERLHKSGFSVGTGATFSVTELTEKNTIMPSFHNATMLMRHHRVVQEIQAAGIDSIPNLYWVDGDQKELQRWADWLIENTGIYTVSRDFTSTREKHTVVKKIRDLLLLLNKVNRPIHVLIVGTGCKIAPLIVRELAKAGYSSYVITSAPIQHAYRNAEYQMSDDGQIMVHKRGDQSIPFSDLMQRNMKVFEQALFDAVKGTGIEHEAIVNVLDVNQS